MNLTIPIVHISAARKLLTRLRFERFTLPVLTHVPATIRIDARKGPGATRLLGVWEAVEKQFQATAGDLREREFPLCREGFGPLVKLVRELDLSACHAVNPTSLKDGVNPPLHDRAVM